ncbi:MAG: hypothetical protein ABI568_13150 [Pseudarthrobacter sp.]
MTAAVDPEETYDLYRQQVDLLESAGRTGAPTQDPRCTKFFGLPYEEFIEALREVRDEIEKSAYLTIVASSEAVLQIDFRARKGGKASVPLQREARMLAKQERKGRRIVLEDVLDIWKTVPNAPIGAISDFKQLLPHRHWLAHGRYFVNRAPVSVDPGFAIARFRSLRGSLYTIDKAFPRQ